MTKLAAIRNNHLSIRCWCGHAGLIPVKAFIEKFGPDITADQAVTKTRCTICGASVRAGSQIVYVGNSEFAMSGSRTAQDSEEGADQTAPTKFAFTGTEAAFAASCASNSAKTLALIFST